MTEIKHLDCIIVEDSYVNVIIIKKHPYCESDSDAIGRSIELLKGI